MSKAHLFKYNNTNKINWYYRKMYYITNICICKQKHIGIKAPSTNISDFSKCNLKGWKMKPIPKCQKQYLQRPLKAGSKRESIPYTTILKSWTRQHWKEYWEPFAKKTPMFWICIHYRSICVYSVYIHKTITICTIFIWMHNVILRNAYVFMGVHKPTLFMCVAIRVQSLAG